MEDKGFEELWRDGQHHYTAKNWQGAVTAIERALELFETYQAKTTECLAECQNAGMTHTHTHTHTHTECWLYMPHGTYESNLNYRLEPFLCAFLQRLCFGALVLSHSKRLMLKVRSSIIPMMRHYDTHLYVMMCHYDANPYHVRVHIEWKLSVQDTLKQKHHSLFGTLTKPFNKLIA